MHKHLKNNFLYHFVINMMIQYKKKKQKLNDKILKEINLNDKIRKIIKIES